MPKDYSINISDFTGIFRAMADKANVNGGNTLDIVEVSIFNEIESTYDDKSKTFLFNKEFYNELGNTVEPVDRLESQKVSTNVEKQKSPEEILADKKNDLAIQKAKLFAQQAEEERNKTVIIEKNINGKDVKISYNKASIENYIINEATDSAGQKLKYYSDIYNIRQKPIILRTKEECRKLIEFNNMVNNAINAGVDYGVDPKLIFAIIQKEVGFNGLNDNVTNSSGKGYMQITRIPICDMLGGYTKNGKVHYQYGLKTKQYGPELEELLICRGFNVNCPPEEKETLEKNIIQYLKENKDGDFNIRLGTLILRYYLNKSNGNIKLAAQKYNGNAKNGIKYAYGKDINKYYNQMHAEEAKTQTIT